MNYTLITGASSGIGMELAKIFYTQGHSLILVARNESRLNALKAQLNSQEHQKIHCIPMDLSIPGASKRLYETLQQNNFHVETLVNNAGYGSFGRFDSISLDLHQNMLQLNMLALTELTHYLLVPMLEQKKGCVLNIASTAAFQGIPFFSVYAATKAYVLHLSEALHEEYHALGIRVSAVCPGATATEFAQRANMQNNRLFQSAFTASSEEVAKLCYRVCNSDRPIVIHGLGNRLLTWLSRWIPRKLGVRMAGKMVSMPLK